MAISSPGIGSGLDVNGIVTKLMSVESQPLTTLATKEAGFQAKLAAYGTVSGGLSTFQSALSGLTAPTKFQQLSTSIGDNSVLNASADSTAVAGSYSVNISQLAQAQTIRTDGIAAITSKLGADVASTLTFQFGTISGGSYTKSANNLSASVASNGIASGSLIINGTNIATNTSTTSAKALAAAINLKTDTTGVNATAAPTVTAALGAFSDVTTDVGDSYTMSVGGVNIANLGASSTLSAADLDSAINDATPGAVGAQLTAAGITVSGSAAAGTLSFTKADGANIAITQTQNGTTTGGFAGFISGTAQITTSAIALQSDSSLSVSGNAPAAAGMIAGSGTYANAAFNQDPNQSSGVINIDATNNTLQGVRDAVNKAKLGVTASIISDGSANPYHLVFTSNKTGAVSSMKVSVSGDATLQGMFTYDATSSAGQKMTESTAAQDTLLSVNGIAINSSTNAVSDAIQGVTMNALKVGSSTVKVSRDTGSITSSINAFVKGYNDLNTALKSLTSYDPATKNGGPLLGDTTVRTIQTGIRNMMSQPIPELSGNALKSLSDIGIAFQKDGALSLDSSKLQTAISGNIDQIAGLFSSLGTSTDRLISFTGSTASTKAGSYAVSILTPASKGSSTGNLVIGGTTTIAPNSSLIMSLDGTTATVPLVAGNFNPTQLASMLQSSINGVSAFSSLKSAVTATINSGGFLNLQSNRFSSTSQVTVVSGTNIAGADLMGAAPVSITGTDVAGSIGGFAATGSGQTLTASGGSDAAGLKILIAENATGGTVNFSQGYAYQLNNLVTSYVQSKGLVADRTTGINSSITEIGKTRDRLNVQLAATEKRYRAQYSALDVAMNKMQTTSTYLTQQLASLAKVSG